MPATPVLTAFAAAFFTIRGLLFIHDIHQILRGKTGWWSINFVNTILAVLAAVIAYANFDEADTRETCPAVDGAFGGVGARIALWLSVGFILLQWLLGVWASIFIGAKSMAAGLLIGNVAIFVCLLLQFEVGQLSFTDAVIGSMVLDIQGSTLLNQLAMKETLVSVWMVGTILLVALAGLAGIGALVGLASAGQWHQCRIFYWDEIQAGGPAATLFWLYYATRWMAYITAAMRAIQCILDLYHHPLVPKVLADPTSFASQLAASFPSAQSPVVKALLDRRRGFARAHGTLGHFGAENFVFAIGTIFNFERLVRLVGHDALDSFGQELGLILAVVSILAAVFGAARAAEFPRRFWEWRFVSLEHRNEVLAEMQERRRMEVEMGGVEKVVRDAGMQEEGVVSADGTLRREERRVGVGRTMSGEW